jgi:hypothetical protein
MVSFRLCMASSLRNIIEEPFNRITRYPFRPDPRSLLHSTQLGQEHTVESRCILSFKLCLNFKSLFCFSDGSPITNNQFKAEFDSCWVIATYPGRQSKLLLSHFTLNQRLACVVDSDLRVPNSSELPFQKRLSSSLISLQALSLQSSSRTAEMPWLFLLCFYLWHRQCPAPFLPGLTRLLCLYPTLPFSWRLYPQR